ncbi:hypothetical protein J27TS7_24650 [Paenibacillus dendritiformis]|uniref:hypothetical protein n=1 Tax=Paenibacillus dendritiformis TaxID=130049 RepID=UPI001B060B79|nr:hypothetical protein [Paenibacillus dendritiformis]GIO72951.1 hypothetical protein J27TS7_24650 [Paenibacillus dendritiformis]
MESTNVPDSIESTRQQWDEEYRSKVWDCLAGITEYARYSVVYGYIRKFLGEEGILDMGCGTGLLFDMLLEEEISHKNTQDPAFAMIERKIEEIEKCGYFDKTIFCDMHSGW